MSTPSPRSPRVTVFLVLAVGFFLQTTLVYLDFPRPASAQELTAPAKRGVALWRKHNCQACHQIHGFGGFLGPDLTNVMGRRPDEDWSYVLTRGRKQMPAFEFDEDEQSALVAFLTEIDKTGTGFPRLTTVRSDAPMNELVRAYAAATNEPIDEAVIRGEREIEENGCNACHVPFDVGTQRSSDLTLSMSRFSTETVRRILIEGKGSMPSQDYLSGAQIDDIVACLEWMRTNRQTLGRFYSDAPNGKDAIWKAVPWFEY